VEYNYASELSFGSIQAILGVLYRKIIMDTSRADSNWVGIYLNYLHCDQIERGDFRIRQRILLGSLALKSGGVCSCRSSRSSDLKLGKCPHPTKNL